MRLMKADTQTFTLKRAETVSSGYVGTKNDYREIGTITGQLSAASDSFSVAAWGDRTVSMFALICSAETDIRKNDRVVLDSGDYTVISVLRYSTHVTATLEKAGAYNGS
ncbi:MAG: hypothetical protein IK990_13045 [Ruminiclostridium sp.]|nr:hypothetical protein [Ruminiclostridium sp.]